MNRPKLIAFDLDDTLLDSKLQIPELAKTTLKALAAQGVYVVLASGRSLGALRPMVQELGLETHPFGRYVLCQNGARIYDFIEDKYVFERRLPTEVLIKAHKIAEEEGIPSQVYVDNVVYASFHTDYVDIDAQLTRLEVKIPESFEDVLREGHSKMVLAADPALIKKVGERYAAELRGAAEYCTSKPFIMEIIAPNWGKGEGLEELGRTIGITLGEMMCFGDSMNDLSMIRRCGVSVAMVNGDEEIKREAAFVTTSTNNDNGVVEFLTKHGIVEKPAV